MLQELRAQESLDTEMTAMHTRSDGDGRELIPVETSRRVKDVSVSTKRRAEKVSSPEDESRETVTILMSLGLVLVNFKVAELFCEDRQVQRCICLQSELRDRLRHRG